MDTTKKHFYTAKLIAKQYCRMKYLELAFYSNSVYISGKLLYAERGIIQLLVNASPECTAKYALYPRELTNLICKF